MITKAKRRAITPIEAQGREISAAIGLLKRARSILRNCGSKNAANYAARALKSAEGALRHAKRLKFEADQVSQRELSHNVRRWQRNGEIWSRT